MNSILKVQQLSLVRQQTVLQSISFDIQPGEIIMLVGPNGAGKSTLTQCVAGVLSPSQGKIEVQQQTTTDWNAKDWARQVSYLPQSNFINFGLTVSETVRLGGLAQALYGETLSARSSEAIERWQLGVFKEREVRRLSGGEQQRCHLARSWLQAQAPSNMLWVLDEPLSALDLQHQKLCLQEIQAQTQQGKSILMVAHDLNLVRHYADRVLLLDQGLLVAEGKPQEVLNTDNISRVFQVSASVEGNYLSWY